MSNWKKNIEDTLEGHLRIIVYNKITKFLEKLKCEKCGSKESLEIHHIVDYKFSDIMCDALDLLKLSYKQFWKEYSENEIKSIEIMVLGLHLYTKFIILCSVCHIKEHQKNNKNKARVNRKILSIKYKIQIEEFKLKYPNSSVNDFFYKFNKIYLKEFIKKYKNKILFEEEIGFFKQELFSNIIVEHIGYLSKMNYKKSIDVSSQGIRVINKILELYNIKYFIISGRCKKKLNRDKFYWEIKSTKNYIAEDSVSK